MCEIKMGPKYFLKGNSVYYIPSIYEMTRTYEESQGTVTNNKKSNKSHLSQRRQAALKNFFVQKSFQQVLCDFCQHCPFSILHILQYLQ